MYRLLSRKTYEMQMFHMSSMKMGLDQAVLKGFETSDAEKAMTKEEVERLLRHGAYDIFNEDKAGTAEVESNNFVEQDIDSILERRSRTVVHDNTGSQSGAAGGTFSKASFSVAASATKAAKGENIDIEDPEFWTKMVGEAQEEVRSELKPRKRNRLNYSERFYDRSLTEAIAIDGSSASGESDFESSDDDSADEKSANHAAERSRWGGNKPGNNWTRNQARDLLECIVHYGYSMPKVLKHLPHSCKSLAEGDVRRMAWTLILLGIAEVARDDGKQAIRRQVRNAEKKRSSQEGGVLGSDPEQQAGPTDEQAENIVQASFEKTWKSNQRWAKQALTDAVKFAQANAPRSLKVFDEKNPSKSKENDECNRLFYKSVWPSLNGRGWKETNGVDSNKTYTFGEYKFHSPASVLNE